MAEAPDIATAWSWLLERRPGTRGAMNDSLLTVAEAAHAEPRLRELYPFPTHGTLHFLLVAPPPWPESDGEQLPFIVCGDPPYKVYMSGYASLLGEAETPAEAATLVANNLPPK